MKRLVIAGAGDLGHQFMTHACAAGSYEPVGFFDDTASPGELRHGLPVLGAISDIRDAFGKSTFDELLIAIGYKHIAFRESLFESLRGSVPFATVVHPSCIVDSTTGIGEGTVVYPGTLLDTNVRIGSNVVLNVAVTIAHDTTIGDHSFISPRVALAGFVTVGKRNVLGINSSVVDNVMLCDDVQLGGGTVVTKDLDQPGLYVGVPSRFVRGPGQKDSTEQ